MKKQNLHTHTFYVDGKDSPEDIVLEAIAREFDSVGFSEHSYLTYSSFPNQLTPEKMTLYKNDVSRLKQKYSGKIDVFCGLEYDFYSDQDVSDLDYVIGSVHYLDCDGSIVSFDRGLKETLCYIDEHFGGNGMDFAKKYFETVSRLPEKHSFDIIGHFDLITKNNDTGRFIDTSSEQYKRLGFEAIHSLRDKIRLFEVNTGAISRGYKSSPYPQIEFMKEFERLGFGAVITSDCHDKAFLDCHFEEAEQLLLAAGFKSKWILTNEGFKEIGI